VDYDPITGMPRMGNIPVADVPHRSDMLEEWDFFYRMANHLGLELTFATAFGFSKYQEAAFEIMQLSQEQKPTIEDLYANICAHSRIPLTEVKKYPHGHIFDSDVRVAEKDPDCTARLDCGNATMMGQLSEVFTQDYKAMQDTPDYPYRYVPRRHNNFMNSSGRSITKLAGRYSYNPIWIHSSDMADIGVAQGDSVRVATAHDYILAVVETDDSLRTGVVAIAHAFGGLVEEDHRYKELGSNTGRLVRSDVDYDPITGMPRMGNIPVAITPFHG
jgi:anaerobic selenocysteine-containing dehydrogenase